MFGNSLENEQDINTSQMKPRKSHQAESKLSGMKTLSRMSEMGGEDSRKMLWLMAEQCRKNQQRRYLSIPLLLYLLSHFPFCSEATASK